MQVNSQNLRVIISKDPQFHNELLERSTRADIFQTRNWGELNFYKGYGDLFYLTVFQTQKDENNESVDDIPLISVQIQLNKSRLIGNWAYVQHGPIFNDSLLTNVKNWPEDWNNTNFSLESESSVNLWKFFMKEFEQWARTKKAFAITMEPLAGKASDVAKLINNHEKTGFKFVEDNKWVLPKYPLYVDLTKDEEDILASFSKNTRYYIRYAGRKGVSIEFFYPESGFELNELISDPKFESFLKLLNNASDRQDYNIPENKYFVKSLELFKGTKNLLIAVAKLDNEIISANFTQIYGNWAGSYYTANSRKYSKMRASYLLKFATQMEAKRQGAKVFDMWGYLPGIDKNHPQYGYGKFKKGFEPVDAPMVGRVNYVLDPIRFKAWKLAGMVK